MNIRPANTADIKPLSALAGKTFIDAFGHSYSPEELKEKIEKTRSEKYFREALSTHTILVAEEFANAAAAISVQRVGASSSMPKREKISS